MYIHLSIYTIRDIICYFNVCK